MVKSSRVLEVQRILRGTECPEKDTLDGFGWTVIVRRGTLYVEYTEPQDDFTNFEAHCEDIIEALERISYQANMIDMETRFQDNGLAVYACVWRLSWD